MTNEVPDIDRAQKHAVRALWIPAAQQCAMREETISSPGDGEVLVKTLFSGVSRGTESLVFNGKVPASEVERMRGPNMAGEFSFPVKYGYAAVGQVIDGPGALHRKPVFCLHPHQDLFVVPEAMVTVLPDALPPSRAVLAANMETALNIVWDAGVLPGDRVAVFGAGVVGALVAYICSSIPGADILLIDRDSNRADLARRLGVPFASSARLEGEFDILINASGAPEALAQALEHAGQEARLVEASWYGEKSANLPLGGAFHSKRLSIISSQVGSVPAARRVRWNFGRRLGKALDLLCDDRLDILISGETDFANLADAYPGILASPQTLCHRIRY